MATTKIGPKHQVTIPKEVFVRLGLDTGDYLEVAVKENQILMFPQKLIPKDQAWFHTPEWQAKEREADKDIARGNLDGPFDSVDKVIAHLRRQKKRQR